MRRFIFTEEVQQALAKERYHHPDPRVQQRMEIVLLKSKGETHERIAELAGTSRRSVQRVLDVFEKDGLDGLRTFHWHGQASALTPHRESLEAAHGVGGMPTDRGIDRGASQANAGAKVFARNVEIVVAKGGRGAGAAEADRGGTRQETGSFFKIRSLSHVWRRPGLGNGRCYLWMRPTSWWRRFWVGSGAGRACLCVERPVGNGTMCWGP